MEHPFPQGQLLPMELGESWSEKRVISIKYDFKPASIDLSNAILQHGSEGSVSILVPDGDGSGNMTTVYSGHSYDPKAGILIHDKETGKVTLERINYAYRVKYVRPQTSSSTAASDAANLGDKRKTTSTVHDQPKIGRPSSARPLAPTAALGAAAPAFASKTVGTPASTPGVKAGRKKKKKKKKKMPRHGPPTRTEEPVIPTHVVFSLDSDGEEPTNNIVISSTTGSSGNDDSDGEASGRVNRTTKGGVESKPSPDCSSRSSSRAQNALARKPRLSSPSSGSGSNDDGDNSSSSSSDNSSAASDVEVGFDATPSNCAPAAGPSNPDRNSSGRGSAGCNSGSAGSTAVPRARYVGNLSDSDSDP